MGDINPDYQCNICLQVVEHPVQHMVCSHNFCSECLNRLLSVSVTSLCPMCRNQFYQDDLRLNESLAQNLQSEDYRCDCGVLMKYSAYNSHSETCRKLRSDIKASVVQPKQKVVNRWTFECPVCRVKNLERKGLIEHFKANHKRASAVCPICTAMPWGDPNYVSHNLLAHMETRHQMDYDTLTVRGI